MPTIPSPAELTGLTRSVDGELCYLDPASTVLRRFTAPGNSVNTGTYQQVTVPIHDARPVRDQLTFERNGFQLVAHSSAVRDFLDADEVERVYTDEVREFVKAFTGADRVAAQSWVLRRSAAPSEHSSQPAAALVHDDYSTTGLGWSAEAAYRREFPDGPGYRRALATSFWRVFSPPPQDWPLAICDYTSVGDDEGLDNRLYFVDEVPDDLYLDLPDDAPGTSGFEFTYNPAHRWWYFPDMTRDEVLFFVLNDSDHAQAWRVPHSAFHDVSVTATESRHSIEFRTIAFFE